MEGRKGDRDPLGSTVGDPQKEIVLDVPLKHGEMTAPLMFLSPG